MLSRREALLAAASGLATAAQAETTNMELIGQPCLARNMHTGCLVQDKGRDYFVLTNTNEITNAELIFIDIEAGTGEVYRAPTGAGAWALQKLPSNQLGVGTYYNGMFLIFDIPSRKWVKTIKFPGEDYLWSFAIGSDDRLYTGTYPGAKLGALDVKTGEVEVLGAPGKPNLYLRNVSTLPDGRIYCYFGTEKPISFVFDPKTKQFSPTPEALHTVTTGVAWNGYFVSGQKAYRMPDLAEVSPLPFPTPTGTAVWQVLPLLSDARNLVVHQGSSVYRFRTGDSTLTRIAAVPTTGISMFAVNEAGNVFGTRGQDYFIAQEDPKKLRLEAVPGPASPREVFFLTTDDQNRLWGGPPFGQTLFYKDLATGQVTNTRGVSNRGGEVYDVEVVDGVAYGVSYVGGEIIRYDPSQPWNHIGGVNPRVIGKAGPEFIRPAAGITRGGDGKLYSGWWAKYGTYGGAVAVTDPQSGATELIVNPLGVQAIQGLAVVGNQVMIGTTLAGNGLPSQPNASAKFGIYDLAERKAVFTHEIPGASSVSRVIYDTQTNRTACIVQRTRSSLWIFDNTLGQFRKPTGVVEKLQPGYLTNAGPGRVAFSEDKTLRLLNLATGAVTTVGDAPEKIHCIAFAPDGCLYVACGAAVYRTAPLPRPRRSPLA
ncbi:MAG: hypothetical protein V4671_07840 [Armatimonadota bacterium]